MTITRLFRALCAGAVVISSVAVTPLSASAASTTEYVIVERDGSVDVRTLTQAQAAKAAIDPAVRIVQPNNSFQIDDVATDIVTGLSVPTNAEVGEVIPGRYIVQFASNTASSVAVASLNSGVIASFSNAINGFVADLTTSEVAALQSNPNVVNIEADRVVSTSAEQSWPGWGLDRIDQRLLPVDNKYFYTETGVGVTAYVVDSGINSTHTDFEGRIQPGFTAVSDGRGVEDCDGHGTHVAGIMAGTKYGVAKSASIVPIRVLDCDGSGTVAGLISGLNWAITDHTEGAPAVANLSVGAKASASLNSAVASAVADGITVVVAAGNANANACNYSPASAPSAITVGATASNDSRSYFSNYGNCLDIFAPGSSITSAYIGSATAAASMSGTSMASPFVAGIAAVYLETRPSASPAAVTKAITDAASREVVGSAGVDSPNKLAHSASFAPAPATVPSVPRALTATSSSQTVALAWSLPTSDGRSAITDYKIEYKPSNISAWTVFAHTASTALTANITGLTNGTQYSFRVSAVNAVGTGTATSPIRATPVAPIILTAPTSPRSLAVYVTFNGATLYWATPAADGGSRVTGYRAEYSADGGTTWTTSDDTAANRRSMSYTNLVGGVLHKFRVYAINAIGTGEASIAVEGTPVAATVSSQPRFFGGFLSGTTAYLSWTRPATTGGSAITSYNTWMSTDSGTTWTSIAATEANVRNVRVTGLTPGVQYQFRVTAANSVGNSAPSATLSLRVRVAGTPNPPSSVRATVDTTSIMLAWSAVVAKAAPVTDYVIEYRADTATAWSTWNDEVSTAVTATLTNMTPDVPVSLRVKAVNRYGESPASAIVTVTPRSAATAPTAPLSVTATAGDTRVAVRWLTPASTGGSVITAYTATSAPGGFTCTTSTNACVVTELTNGTSYSFTVTATNAVGTSVASASSAEVTPTAGGSVTKPAASWGLDRTDQRSLPLDEKITRGGTGAGVSAYVIDTGVYSASVEFGDRVASGFTAFSDGNGSNDCHGHGTHVAGTVGGSTYGFATEATIIPVRVLDCNGSGSTAGIVAGINWIIEHHVAGVPAVANMSLGTNSGIDVAINDAVARGVADGITFVVAAGNSYSDACSFSPSSAALAITVGATDKYDSFADFSNRGSCVDILAPGVKIISAAITSPTSSSMMSGTSMAAPHVAGVVANMLGNAPTMTPTQVATQLVATATKTTIAALPTGTTNALLYQQPASSSSFSLATEVDSSAVDSDITANDSSVVTYEEDPGVPEPPSITVPSTTVPPTVDATPTPSPVDPIVPTKPAPAPAPAPAVPTASPAQPTREVPVEAVAAPTPTAPSPTPSAPAPTTSSPVTSVLSAPLFTSAMTKISIGKITKVGKQLRVTVNAPKGSKVSLYRNGKLVGKGVKKFFMVPASKVKKQSFTAVISVAGAFVSSASVSLR